jgi:DNA-binding FadR family transcriptional regulator
MTSWNILDRVVLTALINHDDSLDVLNELSIVRARLESTMAASTAEHRTEEQLGQLRAAIERMRKAVDSPEDFSAADVAFHELLMALSGNRLAESIARILYERARDSRRFHGSISQQDLHQTVDEHEAVVTAIAASDAEGAERNMESLILDAWRRRRFPQATS